MPVRQFGVQNVNAQTIMTTTELAIATVAIGSTGGASVAVQLEAFCYITTGLGTTACTIRIRRGTDITGTVVGVSQAQTEGASVVTFLSENVVDTPGDTGPSSYTVTVQQAGATANGTINFASLLATVG